MENEELLENVEVEIEDAVDQTVTKLEAAEKEAADYMDKWKRSLAEFDNFRKRTVKEKASMYDDGVKDTIEKILPIMDNFQRALQSNPNKEDTFYKGVEMILRQFEGILDYIGVETIESVGAKFDANVHHAVMHVDDESQPENEVIEEMQKGYKYKDKVIRHSMVKVAN